jgi:hypothetical protein
MRNKLFTVIIVICAFSMITFGFSADSFAKKRVLLLSLLSVRFQ